LPPRDRHRPAKLRAYLDTHEGYLAGVRKRGFVGEDSLSIRPVPGSLLMEGEISCLGGIVVSVSKRLELKDDDAVNPMVLTVSYAYNARVAGHGDIVRDDNADHHSHSDPHHRHTFDWRTNEELEGSPEWVGADGWRTLGQFIDEIEEWYWDHRDELPDPDTYGALGLRE